MIMSYFTYSMLEKDALGKMCPIRKVEGEPFVWCQGSLCMMWEQHRMQNPEPYEKFKDAWINPGDEGYIPRGACGLKRETV